MATILALVALVLGFFLIGQSTVVDERPAESVLVRQVPAVQNGEYQLPNGETVVIYARTSNGPVAPEYQTGYEIRIDATGQAVTVDYPLGSALSPPTAREQSTKSDLGEAGLQALLADLDAAGFFAIPPADAGNEPPPGANTSNITVALADGTWDVQGGVTGADRDVLDEAQRLIADAVGFVPADELS